MKNKLILYKIILLILIIAMAITIALIIKKYGTQEEYEKKNGEVLEIFKQTEDKVDEGGLSRVEFEGYKVIGVIKIPTIDLEYPILEQTTQETMNVSISRFWGKEINSYGNVSLAGHNNRITLTMFGKNKYLKNDDSIYLTDLNNTTIEYKIYNIFNTDPDDVSIIQTTDESIREVTLITCSNGRANRLIIKAREVN